MRFSAPPPSPPTNAAVDTVLEIHGAASRAAAKAAARAVDDAARVWPLLITSLLLCFFLCGFVAVSYIALLREHEKRRLTQLFDEMDNTPPPPERSFPGAMPKGWRR